jgi:thiol-disulfide isomerase/thioredoxin
MKKVKLIGIVLAFSLIFFGCMRGQQTGPGSEVNNPAPEFSLTDLNGKTVNLSQYKGKVIILDFWATWCPPCRSEIPHFIDLYNRYQDKGLVVIGIALDDEGAKVVKPFVDEYKINYPVILGNADVQKAYGGIQGIPTTFIINKNGTLVAEGGDVFYEAMFGKGKDRRFSARFNR